MAKRIPSFRRKPDTSRKIEIIISDLKSKKSVEEIKKTLPQILGIYKKQVVGLDFPKSFKDLNAVFPESVGLEKELCWYACILKIFSQQINNFILMEQDYNNYLLSGQYKLAHGVLNNIEKKFGVSVWLLENRISLLSQSDGIKKQKEYYQAFIDNPDYSHQIKFFAHIFSFRAEQNVSSRKYEDLLKRQIQNVNANYQNYLHFKLNLFGTEKIDSFATVLEMDSGFPIIDRYLTFIRVCQLISSRSNDKRKDYVLWAVKKLGEFIIDVRLQNILQIYNFDNVMYEESYHNLLSIYDQYLSGDYLKSKTSCEEWLNSKNFECFEIYSFYAKSLVRTGEDIDSRINNESLRYLIISNLVEIFKKSENSTQAYTTLLKVVCNYLSHNWSGQLYALLQKEFNSDIIDNSMSIYGELNSNFVSTLGKVKACESELQKSVYIYQLELSYPKTLSIDVRKVFTYDTINKALDEVEKIKIPENCRIKHKAILNEKFGRNKIAINLFKQLHTSQNILDYQAYAAGLARCYIKEKMLSECSDLVTEAISNQEKLYAVLPCKGLIDLIEKSGNDEILGNISIPILYDIYSKYYDVDKEIAKAEKCEDFLSYHGVLRPSELVLYSERFEKRKLVYFLKNLCSIHVLENFVIYESSDDIENERIAVCQILVQLDPVNSDKYSNEIKEITQKHMLQNALHEIEQSKIYVDVEALKNSVAKSLKESFIRYKSLPETFGDIIIGWKLGNGQIVLPSNEKFSLFNSMFIELRDEFISSNIYGLDGYLSVRIRHGTLAGQIRSSMVIENLITSKDGDTNVYKPNEFWKEKYNNLDKQSSTQLLSYLSDFSREIDQRIDRLKNHWLQIQTETKNPDGLFNFCLNPVELKQFQVEANKCSDYEEFINFGIEKLWDIAERSLYIIREKFSKDLKNEINSIFDELFRKVQDLASNCSSGLPELCVSINKSRTSILYELDTIASWFTRSRESDIENYDIHLPLDIGIATILHAYPNSFTPNMNIPSNLTLKGKTLQSFVDVIYTLLDNIVKHAKTNTPPNVDIMVLYEGECLRLIIKNQIHNEIDIEKENSKLNMIIDSLQQQKTWDKVRREGGTGFYKIKKILNFDLRCPHSLNFYIDEEYNFIVEIQINIQGLVV